MPETAHKGRASLGVVFPPRLSTLIIAAILSVGTVVTGTIFFLSKNLPEEPGETLHYPATDFNFAFGSGTPSKGIMHVNEFANGYALITSGPVRIQAEEQRVLRYTWLPPGIDREAAFFWRIADDSQNVLRTEITVPGTQLIDLSAEPGWQGEITEVGLLVAGESGEQVEVGEISLIPDSLRVRLQLTWRAWAAFEEKSQKSVNFLHGGDYRQVVALPLLVAVWLCFTILFLWLLQRFGTRIGARQFLMSAIMLFLIAWILLDIRWASNNLRQARLSIDSQRQGDEQQFLSSDLDGEVYQYVQRLKATVLGNQNARILIIGDENAIDYYLLRAKYHLLPHSVNVTDRFVKDLAPESLDFVIFFGQPASITKVSGWNKAWQQSLVKVDSGNWGTVYRINE